MKKTLISILIGFFLVGAIGWGLANAYGVFSWGNVERELAGLIFRANEKELQIKSGEPKLGSGNLSLQSSVQKADIDALTSASTTPASLYNSDSGDRFIQEVVLYFDASDGSYGAADLAFGVSTSTGAYSTSSFYGFFPVTSFTSSTNPQRIATSTFTVVKNRTWATGEYLNLGFSSARASTTGYMKVIYDKEPGDN